MMGFFVECNRVFRKLSNICYFYLRSIREIRLKLKKDENDRSYISNVGRSDHCDVMRDKT